MQSECKVWAGRVARSALCAAAVAVAIGRPVAAEAQVLLPPGLCDFDVADDQGQNTWGATTHLVGRSGAGSNRGTFIVINGNTAAGDVDKDGFDPTCTFSNLFVSQRTNLVHVERPDLAIPGVNIIVANFPRVLEPGEAAEVMIFVEIPAGTVAGRYQGRIEIRDDAIFTRVSPSGDILNIDSHLIELEVVEGRDFTIVEPDSAVRMDSVVVRGRSGERATSVFRIANTGNVDLSNLQLTATDLRSESAIGVTIPASRVSFTPGTAPSLGVSDTMRVTVTVDIPRGLLGGRYRGSIIAQTGGTAAQEIPLVVIVSSTRGIVFSTNPVRSAIGDIAQIAFNGDPGTTWKLGIFDMAGLLAFEATGTVFPGFNADPPATLGVGADFAVNVAWPLLNGRGEDIASGMYLVVVESVVNGQRQQAQNRLMVIR